MMRSLWTAASGMVGQQFSIDTIANNLANVNTAGFKEQSRLSRFTSIRQSATPVPCDWCPDPYRY